MNRQQVYSLIEKHYRANQPSLIKKIRNATGGHHNAEDCVQEAYTRACTYWNTYDPTLSIDAWINGILSNCIKDSQKDSILKGMVKDDLAAMPDPPSVDVTDGIFVRQVTEKLKALPKHVAFIVKLYLLDGYTGREISEITNYKQEAIRQMVSRFRKDHLDAEGIHV